MARMPRLFARRARSIASIERGTPSGSEWACMSIAPVRVCAIDGVAIRHNRAAEIIHGLLITFEDYCRLSIFPDEGVWHQRRPDQQGAQAHQPSNAILDGCFTLSGIMRLVLQALKQAITRRRALL